MYNKRLVTLDFVFPARDLMTRELEMRPMDDGEKLTWTGSSFCQYNAQITFRWWLTHNNTIAMKLCWSIIQTDLGLKSSLRVLWASTMWAKHGLYLEPKKKNFCIWQYSRLAGTRKETQVRWGPIGLCPRLWIGISRFKCLLGPPCCVLRKILYSYGNSFQTGTF